MIRIYNRRGVYNKTSQRVKSNPDRISVRKEEREHSVKSDRALLSKDAFQNELKDNIDTFASSLNNIAFNGLSKGNTVTCSSSVEERMNEGITVGTILGGAVGTVFAPGVGTGIGAAVGAGLGALIGGVYGAVEESRT